jgi:hypothetical protein
MGKQTAVEQQRDEQQPAARQQCYGPWAVADAQAQPQARMQQQPCILQQGQPQGRPPGSSSARVGA